MDDIARRYVLLGLRLGRHVAGFVDSYVGPPELRAAVEAEPTAPLQELVDEAAALGELVAQLTHATDGERRRREWLRSQLVAMSALAHQAAGETVGYLDLVEALFGTSVVPIPEEHFADARRTLDAALPGSGSLNERYRSMSQSLEVPPARVMAVMRASAERFRTAARRDFDMPPEEAIEWGETRDQPWGAEARFQGDGRTLIRLNLDLPRNVGVIAYLASHEGYPGHHLDHVTKEQTLIRARGLGEATLRTMNTPESMLAEGAADVAREVVMSDLELADEIRRIARDAEVGGDLDGVVPVASAVRTLQGAAANAAIMLHADARPAAEVREYLLETSAQPTPMVDHLMRTLGDPIGRTYPFTYTEGARLVRAWLEIQGQTTGYARLLAEQHTPAGLSAATSQADD